jgi:putative DNA methylase
MTSCKKLIEVSMPVKEISAESIRDKSIRHGHISTLHLWWARRPLPVCRAVVFASLVFDPLDKNCPKQFKDAVKNLLSEPRYKPYEDIPWTAAKDPLEDNLRNRLIAFVGKFSEKYIDCEAKGKTCPPKEMLSDYSLIKWEARKNDEIINIARKLIWVAHDPEKNTIEEFERCFDAIKKAEASLYGLKDRHIDRPVVKEKQEKLDAAIKAFLDRMPRVFDPFAGGGAIPLEAARLGCNSFANDLNPVAHIIEKASLEFPQKYGKPIVYGMKEFEKIYGDDSVEVQRKEGNIRGDEVHIPNRLAWDVEYYCKKMLVMAEKEIGHLYPADEKGNKPVAYYWARVGTCANPSCRAKVPLLKGFYLCDKPGKWVHIKPKVDGKTIFLSVEKGQSNDSGWLNKSSLTCPCCGNVTPAEEIRRQVRDGEMTQKLVAVIYESDGTKTYQLPSAKVRQIVESEIPRIGEPQEPLPSALTGGSIMSWGLTRWGEMFTDRQLLMLNTLVSKIDLLESNQLSDSEYDKAIITYLVSVRKPFFINTARLSLQRGIVS